MIDFDFHTHTYPQSECATQSIEELVKKAYESGIRVLSVCNHNTLSGLDEARKECGKYGIDFLNGVELTCEIVGERCDLDGTIVHIVGLNIDNDISIFDSYTAPVKRENEERFLGICRYLHENGYKVKDCTELSEMITQLVVNGRFTDRKSAKKFIYSDEIELLFPTKRLSHKQAIDLIHRLNGIAIWAHPVRVWRHDKFSFSELTNTVERFCACGLDGLEVFHPDNLKENGATEMLMKIATDNNLVITLGSDSHHLQDKGGYFPLNRALNDFDFDFGRIRDFREI